MIRKVTAILALAAATCSAAPRATTSAATLSGERLLAGLGSQYRPCVRAQAGGEIDWTAGQLYATGAGRATGSSSKAVSSAKIAARLDAARNAAREHRCLAEAIYYEARSETLAGQMAVAEVVINRSRHRAYPNSICGVVYQGSERRTGCQFTFTCDGSMISAPYGRGWDRAQNVADHALMGFARPVTNRATHYHTTAVDPHWNDSLVRTRRIGSHIFYRFPNRSERRLLAEREA